MSDQLTAEEREIAEACQRYACPDDEELVCAKLLRLQDAALARIAELEAKLETTSERAQWDLDWRIEAEALTRKLDTRISQAVAAFEKLCAGSGIPSAKPGIVLTSQVESILEMLR